MAAIRIGSSRLGRHSAAIQSLEMWRRETRRLRPRDLIAMTARFRPNETRSKKRRPTGTSQGVRVEREGSPRILLLRFSHQPRRGVKERAVAAGSADDLQPERQARLSGKQRQA
jgi:hypothetical protein